MKFTKKKVFVSAMAICLIAILSFGTLAWFTDSDEVTNKFMVADSESDPDKLFSVDVYETAVDENGTVKDEDDNGEADTTQIGNTYTNILPGDVLPKDPTVKNTGKYNQWVRLKVTLTDAADWMRLLTYYNITDITTIFEGYNGDVWQSEGNDNPVLNADGSLTFIYYLKNQLAPGQTATLFNAVKIPSVLNQVDMAQVPEFEIKVVAEAIQAENTGESAIEAFKLY